MADDDRHAIDELEPRRTVEVGEERWICRSLGATLAGYTVGAAVPATLVGFSREGEEEVLFEALLPGSSLAAMAEDVLIDRVTKTRTSVSE